MSIDQLLSDHLDAPAERDPIEAALAPERIRAAGRRRTNRRNALLGGGFVVALLFGVLGIWVATTDDKQTVNVAESNDRVATNSPVVVTDDGFVTFRNVFDDGKGDPHVEIFRSPDGEDWEYVEGANFPPVFVQEHAFYDGGRYVVVGSPSGESSDPLEANLPMVATSQDLLSWEVARIDVPEFAEEALAAEPWIFLDSVVYSGDRGMLLLANTDRSEGDLVVHSSDLKSFAIVEKFERFRRVSQVMGVDDGFLVRGAENGLGDRWWRSADGRAWVPGSAAERWSFPVTAVRGQQLLGSLGSAGPRGPVYESLAPIAFSPDFGATVERTAIDQLIVRDPGDLVIAGRASAGEAGFAVAYNVHPTTNLELPQEERFGPSHVLFSPDGSTWMNVANDLDGWVSQMVVGDDEIVLVVMEHVGFETTMIRIPVAG